MRPVPAPRRAEKLLIVDDDPAHLELVQRMVERMGYDAVVVQDVASALAIFREQFDSIDLVITDVVMSTNDGECLVRELISSHPGVRILLSTGLHSSEVEELVKLGVKGVLYKPYQSEQLLAAIRETLAE